MLMPFDLPAHPGDDSKTDGGPGEVNGPDV